jgi:hypothetical protein
MTPIFLIIGIKCNFYAGREHDFSPEILLIRDVKTRAWNTSERLRWFEQVFLRWAVFAILTGDGPVFS